MRDLSIIIVNWNTRDVTLACLQSVFDNLAELGKNERTEVFVVDNASTDGSQSMIRETFPQVRLIENRNNRGFGPANNQAIRLATGQYLLLLNSDTVVLGDVVQKSLEYLDKHPNVGVMGCRTLNADRTVQLTCLRYPSVPNLMLAVTGLSRLRWPRFCGRERMADWQRDDEREVDVVSGSYMLIRRTAMNQVGPLDESFFFCGEETDWCRRFHGAGWCVRFAPVGEIVHYGNISGARWEWRRDLLLSQGIVRFLRKHDGKLAALLAYLLIVMFWATRAVVWRVLVWLRIGGQKARNRADHFCSLLRNVAVQQYSSIVNGSIPIVRSDLKTDTANRVTE